MIEHQDYFVSLQIHVSEPNAQLKNVDLVQYCGIQYLVLWRKKHYNQNARFGAILKR